MKSNKFLIDIYKKWIGEFSEIRDALGDDCPAAKNTIDRAIEDYKVKLEDLQNGKDPF